MRAAVGAVLGAERAERFFDRLLDALLHAPRTRERSPRWASTACGCRSTSATSSTTPRRSSCSRRASSASTRAIRACADAGLYSVIDLHAVPGCQNQHWHSDNPTHVAAFWQHPHFQDRVVHLWRALAERYRDDARGRRLQPAQRARRPERRGRRPVPRPARGRGARGRPRPHRLRRRQHLLDRLQRRSREPYRERDLRLPRLRARRAWPSAARTRARRGQWIDRDVLEETFLERTRSCARRARRSGSASSARSTPAIPSATRCATRCSPTSSSIYERHAAGWSLWTYKDVGLQGLVTRRPRARTCSASVT